MTNPSIDVESLTGKDDAMADVDIASNPVDETDLAGPSIEEAMNQASSTLSSSPKESKEPTDQDEPEAEEEEASEKKEAKPEADEESQDEKAPLDEFDPEKLPDELKPLYKNLMKGFTQGRQKDREEVNKLKKELDELRQMKPEEAVAKNLTPEEYVEELVTQKVSQKELESFRNQALTDYNQLDPRLNKDGDKHDRHMDAFVGAGLDALMAEYVQENGSELGFDYKTHGKQLVAEWDSYLNNYLDAKLEKQKELAKRAEKEHQKANPKSSSGKSKPTGPISLEKAAQMAFQRASK